MTMHLVLVVMMLMTALTTSADPTADLFAAIRSGDSATVRRLLKDDPALAKATSARGMSAVTAALFRIDKGFIPPQKNAVLHALLEARPEVTFYEACGIGDAKRVEAMLARKPSLANEWHPIGWSPLHFATFSGDLATVDLLLARGAAVDVRAKTKFKNTPLQTALLTGQFATARRMLEKGADPLVRQNEGFAPIHEAALLGRRDLVELLLEHGAELNSRADDGRTALTEAIRGRHSELAAFLESKGAAGGEITADLMKSPE